MSIVFTKRVGEKWKLFCEACCVELDVVSSVELMGLQGKYTPVMCFDCSGDGDEIPDVLYSGESPYLLILNGRSIVINPWRELENSRRRLNQWEKMFKEAIMTEEEVTDYDRQSQE